MAVELCKQCDGVTAGETAQPRISLKASPPLAHVGLCSSSHRGMPNCTLLVREGTNSTFSPQPPVRIDSSYCLRRKCRPERTSNPVLKKNLLFLSQVRELGKEITHVEQLPEIALRGPGCYMRLRILLSPLCLKTQAPGPSGRPCQHIPRAQTQSETAVSSLEN